MSDVLIIIGLLALAVGVIVLIVNAIKKRGLKLWSIVAASGLALLIIGCVIIPSAEPQFELTNLTIELTEAVLGDSVDVSVNIENIGDAEGTYAVTLKVDGVAKMTREITLDAGASEVVTFVITEGLGTHSITIDGLTTAFEVTREWRVTVLSVEKETGPVHLVSPPGRTIEPAPGYTFLFVEIKFEKMRPEYKLLSEWVILSDSTGHREWPVAHKSLGGLVDIRGAEVTIEASGLVKPPWTATETFVYCVSSDAEGLRLVFLDYPPMGLGA